MRRYLIVANQTLGGDQLSAKLAECMRAGPCRFYLVAPVTQTEASDRWAAGGLDGRSRSHGDHIRKTPKRGSGSSVRATTSSARPKRSRVSAGSITPSSHSRAVA